MLDNLLDNLKPLQRFTDFRPDYIAGLAQQHGYTYVAESLGDTSESSLYNNPQTRTIERHKLQFEIAGLACEYYTASYTPLPLPGVIQDTSDIPNQVFSITLPYSVENLYVESRTNITINNILGASSVSFRDTDRIQVEGDFNYFFRVYAPRGEELTAFTILAPNIMLQLLAEGGNYDFEFSGSKIYFYKTFSVMRENIIPLKQADYDHMLQFGLTTAASLARASRPAKLTDTTGIPQMWQLYGASQAKRTAALVILFGGFISIGFAILIPLFWLVLILLAAIFFVRYRQLVAKRRRLARNWQGR